MPRRAFIWLVVLGLGPSCPASNQALDAGADSGLAQFDGGQQDAGGPDSGRRGDSGVEDAGCVASITVIPSPYETNAIGISDDGKTILLNLAKGAGWQAALFRDQVVELAPGRYLEFEAKDMDDYGVVGRVFQSPEINPAWSFFFPFDGGALQLIPDAGGEALAARDGHIVGQQHNGTSFWLMPDGSIRRSDSTNITRLATVFHPRAGGVRPTPQQTGVLVNDSLALEFAVDEFPSSIRKVGETWAVGGVAGRPTIWRLSDGAARTLPLGTNSIGAASCADEAGLTVGGGVIPSVQIDIEDARAAVWRGGELVWVSTPTAELRVIDIVDVSESGRSFLAQCSLNASRKACTVSLSCL